MNFWKRSSNWTKLKDTVQGAAAIMQVVLVANDANHLWNYVTGAVQLISLFVTIWGADQNRNDIPDIFEEEVKVTVKSESPVEVEVTKKEN
jgi:hypothetical protein